MGATAIAAMDTPPAASLSPTRVLTVGPVVAAAGADSIGSLCSNTALIGFARSVKKLEPNVTLVSTVFEPVPVVDTVCVCATGAVFIVFADVRAEVLILCDCGAFTATALAPGIS